MENAGAAKQGGRKDGKESGARTWIDKPQPFKRRRTSSGVRFGGEYVERSEKRAGEDDASWKKEDLYE